jgi:MFS family permease
MRRRLPRVLQECDYARLLGSSLAYGFGREMVFVAVGWQVYDISRNPFHLGLIGLAEFLPLLLFALPAGAISDRFSRKHVYLWSIVVDAAITAGLLAVSLSGADELWPFLAL